MTVPQSTCSCFQNQAQAELSMKINALICKLTTLRDLGGLFMEDDALCVPACVIQDYTGLSLVLIEEIETLLFPVHSFVDDRSGDQP